MSTGKRTATSAGLARWVGLLVAATLLGGLGCASESYSRSAEMTHWHDEDTLIMVYTRQQTGGTLGNLVRPEPQTMHVRVCKVLENNEMECHHQRELTNMLNPHLVNDEELDDRWYSF